MHRLVNSAISKRVTCQKRCSCITALKLHWGRELLKPHSKLKKSNKPHTTRKWRSVEVQEDLSHTTITSVFISSDDESSISCLSSNILGERGVPSDCCFSTRLSSFRTPTRSKTSSMFSLSESTREAVEEEGLRPMGDIEITSGLARGAPLWSPRPVIRWITGLTALWVDQRKEVNIPRHSTACFFNIFQYCKLTSLRLNSPFSCLLQSTCTLIG